MCQYALNQRNKKNQKLLDKGISMVYICNNKNENK